MAEEKDSGQYVVLARKYRPQNFDDVVGQDALVQTLTNAIKSNRLHHAYMLTGIRGTGKTTTARIIAKALNCTGLDGKGGPTAHPCGACENCRAIAEDRHIDVLELDAASRTGVDDMREILEGVRYKPTSARYKVYIIDEVHMLSKSAFNALLKTLEEPPAHVKFVFATTEIRKVPVTVLSRCQRFDLQRLAIADLHGLFAKLLEAEGLGADEESLRLIAKAADGSARDGLSLLDQAISLGNGEIKAEIVKRMIGLADRTRTFDLFESLLEGDTAKVLKNLQEQYRNGANPLSILQDLVACAHMLAKAKIVPAFASDPSLGEAERELVAKLKDNVSIAVLSKVWQMLLKGISELAIAPSQIDAAEMILIRIAYSANLPTPAEILDGLKKKPESNITVIARSASDEAIPAKSSPPSQGEATARRSEAETAGWGSLDSLSGLAEYLEKSKQPLLLYGLKNDIAVSSFENGKITLTASERLHQSLIPDLHKALKQATGRQWEIEIQRGPLGETLADKEKAAFARDTRDISEYPLVRAILDEFKGAKFETLTRKIKEESTEEIEAQEETLL